MGFLQQSWLMLTSHEEANIRNYYLDRAHTEKEKLLQSTGSRRGNHGRSPKLDADFSLLFEETLQHGRPACESEVLPCALSIISSTVVIGSPFVDEIVCHHRLADECSEPLWSSYWERVGQWGDTYRLKREQADKALSGHASELNRILKTA